MSAAKLQIPTGMQDTLPGECHARRVLERSFRRIFRLSGYREIKTPVLEYYDVLSDRTYGYKPEHVWKTFDSFGRVLAVRPDSTIPAARIAAGSLKREPLPLRLSYVQNATAFQHDTLSLLCEQPQAGVELMGEAGAVADAEVIALAVSCLETAGLRDFQMELGQAAFCTGFLRENGLTDQQALEVQDLVERKDIRGLRQALAACGVTEEAAARLMQLPELYGGPEVLEEAKRLSSSPACLEAVERLQEVQRRLKDFGCEAPLTFDLGMAQATGYYSGIIFRAHAPGAGQPILSGGRYDGLTARFGRPLPAVGFALMLKLLMIALERQGMAFTAPPLDWLIGGEAGLDQAMIAQAQAKRAKGESAALCYTAAREDLQARVSRGDAAGALWVTAAGAETLRQEKEG